MERGSGGDSVGMGCCKKLGVERLFIGLDLDCRWCIWVLDWIWAVLCVLRYHVDIFAVKV
jgi:hypothetical protein